MLKSPQHSSRRTERSVVLAGGLAALLAVGGVAYAAEFRGGEGGFNRAAAEWQTVDHRGGMRGGMREGMMGGGMGGMPMMMGGRLCNSSESIVPRMTQRLERSVTLTDAQKPDFENLKQAMTKAEQALKSACPTEAERNDRTPTGRLALAEKRMSAGLEAIRTVRPAFDTFYGKLDDKQRDQLRWAGRGMGDGMGRGERGHHWR